MYRKKMKTVLFVLLTFHLVFLFSGASVLPENGNQKQQFEPFEVQFDPEDPESKVRIVGGEQSNFRKSVVSIYQNDHLWV